MLDKKKGKAELIKELAAMRLQLAETRQARIKLEQAEDLNRKILQGLRTVVENMPVMIDALDSKGRIVVWNRECKRVSGYNAEQIINNPKAFELLYPDTDYRKYIMEEWARRGNDYRNWEWKITSRDGSIKTVLWSNISDRFPIPGWATWGVGVDITKLKLAEAALSKSERQFRTLVETMNDGLVVESEDGLITYVNDKTCEMFGYSKDEMIGHKTTKCVDPGNLAVYERETSVRKEKYRGMYELLGQHKDGRKIPLYISARAIFDEKNQYRGNFAVITEMTRYKEVEQALRESEEKYRTVVENAGEAICVIDEKGTFLFMNATGAQWLGGGAENYVGKTLRDVLPQKTADRYMYLLRQVVNTGRGDSTIAKIELQGRPRWVGATVKPLRNGDEKITAALIIARDIHELKQAEEELKEFREKMVQAERLASLGTLSATLAHELTQPLTIINLSIANSVAKLEKIPCPDTVIENLKDSLAELSTAVSILDRFRGFARKSSRKTNGTLYLGMIIEKIVRLLNKSARHANMVIQTKSMDKLPPIVCNQSDVEQVFFAIIQNAIQAADGKKNRRLTIIASADNDNVKIRFADDCRGIRPGNIDKIFEPFFTTKQSNGTGLGLCIVRQIVSKYSGDVRVKSKFGKGTTFYVTLPIRSSTV